MIADTNMCAAPVAYVLHRSGRVYRFFFFFFFIAQAIIRLCYVTVTHEIHITALTRKTTREYKEISKMERETSFCQSVRFHN